MIRILLLALVCGLFVLSSSFVSAEEVVYVQSTKAKIMSAPSFKSVVIGTVPIGRKLTTIGREKDWVKVTYDYQKGFLPAILVSPQPPLKKVTFIKAEQGDEIKVGVRRRASTFTSAAAARGLTADDRSRLNSDEKANYASLENVDGYKVSNEEIAKFMEGLK